LRAAVKQTTRKRADRVGPRGGARLPSAGGMEVTRCPRNVRRMPGAGLELPSPALPYQECSQHEA
jgi:hypothetical protein